MQITEKYTTVLGPLQSNLGKEYICTNWRVIEEDVYQKTGIYIDAVIRLEEIIWNGFSECGKKENNCAIITCLRNPVVYNNDRQYENALMMILRQLMKLPDIKYLAVDIQEIQFAFFPTNYKKQ